MINIESIIADLRRSKLRITKLRKATLKIFSKVQKPISVAELRIFLSKLDIKVHKTSIYRELVVLKKEGIVREIQFDENKKRYELESHNQHSHIICIKCNKVECDKVENSALEKDLNQYKQKIMKQKKIKVTNYSLDFFGLCAKCNS